jgi:hypothetical protein
LSPTFGLVDIGLVVFLPSWQDWVRLLDELDNKAEGALAGTVNLHEYETTIDQLAVVYSNLRREYLAGN